MSDNQLTDLLLYYAYMEQEIEVLREILCSESQFQPYNLFKLIDCLKDDPKGYLTAADLEYYLSLLKFPSNLPAKTFIENYNLNKDGNLVYSEAILPIGNQELREKITQRAPNNSCIDEKTQYFFAKLIEAEIKLTIQAENYKKSINPDYFNKICYQEFIYHQDLMAYFKSKHITTNAQEIQQIFNRIDLLNDGKIDIHEWKLWIKARRSTQQINSNSYKKQSPYSSSRYSSAKRRQHDSTMTDLVNLSKQGYYSSKKPPLQSYNTPKKYQQQKTDLRAQLNQSSLYNSNQSYCKTTIQKPAINSFYDEDIRTLKKAQSVSSYESLEPVNYYVQLFVTLMQIVKKIERQKILLSQHDDFTLYTSFQKLDKGFKGILIKSDLLFYCKNPQIILNRYGKDNRLRFSEYIKLVEPQDQKASENLLNKEHGVKTTMLPQTETSLRLLFELIEQFLTKINEARDYQNKYQFDFSEIFYMLAYDRQQITQQDLQDFLQANQVQGHKGIDLLLIELDYDGDGQVTYQDFLKIFGK